MCIMWAHHVGRLFESLLARKGSRPLSGGIIAPTTTDNSALSVVGFAPIQVRQNRRKWARSTPVTRRIGSRVSLGVVVNYYFVLRRRRTVHRNLSAPERFMAQRSFWNENVHSRPKFALLGACALFAIRATEIIQILPKQILELIP